MIKTLVLLLGAALLAGCAPADPDPMRSALQQLVIPPCGGSHSVSVTQGPAVAEVRSECKPPAAKPE